FPNNEEMMKRRDFIGCLGAAGFLGALRFRLPLARAATPSRLMWVTLQADGGHDQALFCDPKPAVRRVTGTDAEVRTAGNIPYAGFSDLGKTTAEGFFGKYYNRMLVFNGIDTGTNNHAVGSMYCATGSSNTGYPCFAASVAAVYGSEQPLGFLS